MWTRAQITTAYDMAVRGFSLAMIAQRVEHTAAEVDLALWTMMGRSLPEAFALLNGQPRVVEAS